MTSLLIRDVRVFDGQDTIEKGYVLIKDDLIADVGDTPPINYDGPVISKANHTLLPGLIDMHVHIDVGNELGLVQGLRFGVTTQCDLGNASFWIDKLRVRVRDGDCSDLKAAGPPASPEGGWPTPILKLHGIDLGPSEYPFQTQDDGRKFVRDRIREGVDFVKMHHESGTAWGMELPKLPSPVQRAMVDEAHRAGLPVVAHALSLDDTIEILSQGVDGTVHTIVDKPPTPELVEAYKKANAFCNPTLTVIGTCTKEGVVIQERFAHDPRVQDLMFEGGKEQMCACSSLAMVGGASLNNAIESVRMLKEAGIDILCGTDSSGIVSGTAYGLSLHQELSMLVHQCGFTPIEAIQAATVKTAKRLQFRDRGSIRQGLRADLVLVEGNPLKNIDDTLNLRGVWSAGRMCSYYEDK